MLFLSFLAGVILFYTFNYFPFSTLFIGILCSAYLMIRKKSFLILIIVLGIAFSFLRFKQEDYISTFAGKEVVVKGVFQSFPVRTESGNLMQALDIKSAVDKMTGEQYRELVGKKVILFTEDEFHAGSEYTVLIKFLSDKKRYNPGGMVSEEIYAKLLEVMNPGDESKSLISKVQDLRYRLGTYFSEHLTKDSAAFVSALTIGQTASLDKDLRNAFNATGLAHILSISGTHFGLFSVFLFSLFSLIIRVFPYRVLQRITIFLTPSQAAAILSFPFMLAYFGLSGGSIPATRSFIMVSLFLLGLLIGRKGLWLNSLLFAAFVLTLWDPRVILDLSFQLSFIAVLFIGFATEIRKDKAKEEDMPLKEKKRHQVFRRFTIYLLDALLLTLSASIGTALLVAYHFHYFSTISPLSNLIITPIIGFILTPLSIFSSFLFLATGHFVFTPVVSAVSDVSITLVRLFSTIPFADIKIPAFPPIIVLLFYAGFVFYLLLSKNTFSPSPSPPPLEGGGWGRGNFHSSLYQLICRNVSSRKRYTLIIPFVPLLVYFSLTIFEKKELSVTYLDVGQGDSAVIELPDKKTLAIDTGRTGRETASYLQYIGKETIDALILSHIHPDHTGGLDYLVKGFKIKELWDSGRMILPENIMSSSGAKRRILQRGDKIEGDGYNIYILHPYPEFYSIQGNEYVEANNDSLVIRIEGRNKSFLFTGDVEAEAEEDISSFGARLKSDAIKVPHHGGKTSAFKPFLDLVSPEVAVISSGRDNTFGHPHPETLDALHGVRIIRTDTDGAVKIKESSSGFEIKTFRDYRLERTRSFAVELENIKRLFRTW